jgi:hypothetical protein
VADDTGQGVRSAGKGLLGAIACFNSYDCWVAGTRGRDYIDPAPEWISAKAEYFCH